MGLFDQIKDKIFGHKAAPAGGSVGSAAPTPSPTGSATPTAPTPAAAPARPQASPGAAPTQQVDVAAMLDQAVAASGQKLDWRKSIVDMMKALGIDSSLSARKEMAHELGYTGSTTDSAAMNVWLHKQVIQKLKDNGGKVPADLLH